MASGNDAEISSSIRRRDVLAVTGAGVTAALAGCGVGDTNTGQQPLSGDSITIGALGQAASTYGMSILNGADLAAQHINSDGGIAGATIDLATPEQTGENYQVAKAHERMCEDDCKLTVGLTIPNAVEETLPSIATQETVHLTTGSVDGQVGRTVAENYDEYKYHFRMGLPDMEALATALSTYVEEQAEANQWESAAVVTSNSSVITPFREHLIDSVSEYMDVPYQEVDNGTGPYGPVLDEVEQEGCDVLLFGSMVRGTEVVNLWAEREMDFALGGFSWQAMRPQAWNETDGSVESVFVPNALTPSSENTPQTLEFVTAYEEAFEELPLYSGALTYDALYMYREVVEGLVEGAGEFPEQEAIVEALEETSFTDGVVYPEFDFTGPGAEQVHEPVWESMAADTLPVIQQWQQDEEGTGTMEAVAPEQVQTATYESPPWMT